MAVPENETRLDEDALASLLTSGTGWTRDRDTLTKTYTFKGFKGAMAFVNRVAEAASAANHHPDIHLEGYKTVRIVLTTHLTGGISDADVGLAETIDKVLERPGAQLVSNPWRLRWSDVEGRPRIYVDFQKTDGRHGYPVLDTVGTREDLARYGIELKEGLELVLYSDDGDDEGHADPLLARGVARFDSAIGKWVAHINRSEVRSESEVRRDR